MHVLIGLIGIGLTIAYTLVYGHTSGFQGVLHGPSLVLLGVGPLFMAITAYPFRDLGGAVGALVRALGFDSARSRARLFDDLTRFAAEARARRAARALEIAEASGHPMLRQLGPLVVRQYASRELEATAQTALYVLVSERKRAEDVFTTLSRVAPATGLVGTVLGLISLLRDLRQFDQLGPSMALALLCTFYGLLLANALYQPLARVIHRHTTVLVEEAKLLTRALALVAEDKPLADVRKLFELSGAGAPGASAPGPDVALGGGA